MVSHKNIPQRFGFNKTNTRFVLQICVIMRSIHVVRLRASERPTSFVITKQSLAFIIAWIVIFLANTSLLLSGYYINNCNFKTSRELKRCDNDNALITCVLKRTNYFYSSAYILWKGANFFHNASFHSEPFTRTPTLV